MKIINLLKKKNKLNETIFLGMMSLFAFDLTMFRLWFANEKKFLFLNWNLFLAFLPWVFSTLILLKVNDKKDKKFLYFFVVGWILLLPNSFYILTDFFHFRLISKMPEWFDLLLILFFVWLGLLYGILSILDMEKVLKSVISPRLEKLIISVFFFVISFGIYLGRYLRWNSWDVLSSPYFLFKDIFDIFFFPFSNLRAWSMTILMGIFLNLIYWSFRLVRRK